MSSRNRALVTFAAALIAMTLSACWVTSLPEGDPKQGCTKTTYGFLFLKSSSTSCTSPTGSSGSVSLSAP
jgi:hypothetical protein